MENVDVLVVGGGPAGTMAARRASEGGLLTMLVEVESELGSQVHTSGATEVQTMLPVTSASVGFTMTRPTSILGR